MLKESGCDDGYIYGGAKVGREVGSSKECCHSRIGLIKNLGEIRLYAFAFPPEPRGWCNLLVAVAEADMKSKVGENCEEV